MRIARLSILLVRHVVPALLASGMCAQSVENDVKAAMLFNFTRFVEWPETAWKDKRAPLVIGILGADPFGQLFDDSLRDKSYNGRPVRLQRVKSADESRTCHLVFISRSERPRLADTLRVLQTASALTVSDLDGFITAGGMIGLVVQENRVRFVINSDAAARAGIKISSKLLRLAAANERYGE